MTGVPRKMKSLTSGLRAGQRVAKTPDDGINEPKHRDVGNPVNRAERRAARAIQRKQKP